ncbi:GIY-YIG nuclease family protein [Curtobacterium sp. MCBD17_030]|uniref:GIY-YIG nuclease family protein n=1 Tax=Curtobacterium sp. MCBD17_030 TaxID=2175649 RepID=UPI0015E884D4|nr:GIY-YIG nuclease family protein [Curtobacterium sp. MCBD17_030]
MNDEFRQAVGQAATRDRRHRVSVVYFVQQGNSGPIKIGCTRNLKSRVNSLQTSSAEPLNVLGTVPGGFELERQMHEALSPHRLSGEWFAPTPKVLRLIKKQLALPTSV